MSTLLRSWSLVLDMDTSSTFLDEKLRQLHNRSQASVPSIGIGDNRAQIVDVGKLAAVSFREGGNAFFALLAIVEELCHEEMGDLIRDGGLVEISIRSSSSQ
jgi:hypothetical protein